jgi:hypothetical protein
MVCLILIALVNFTAVSAPLWIYWASDMVLQQIRSSKRRGCWPAALPDRRVCARRGWLLLIGSALEFSGASAVPIRNFDFYFPSHATLAVLGWALHRPAETRGAREKWIAGGVWRAWCWRWRSPAT